MKRRFLCFLTITLLFTGCSNYMASLETAKCTNEVSTAPGYSKAGDIDKILEQITMDGAPGVALAVQSDEGLWCSAKGYAKIEDKTPMQTCHLQYLQSISKMYMAVVILKLYEQGKIELDGPIRKYLPEKYSKYIADSGKITVRMLLNHTSGIPEYNFAPSYVSYLLQHPEHYFTFEDYLKFIEGKKLRFTPGDRHVYTNTNYLLLALIADVVAGNHAKMMTETIFKPLGLSNTYYRNEPGYLAYPLLVNSYWDRYGNGVVENASALQKMNVSTLTGDDGIVTTPADAVKFLKALAEGKLLSKATMQQMQTWVNNKNGKPVYGLGLNYRSINGITGYGHSGGGIGAGCELYYFPKKNLCYFIAVNLGTVTESPLHKNVERDLGRLYELLLK